MKTFRRLISNGKSAGYLLVGVIVCALLMAAGVNGLFNHVTSTTGYQVNGAAGSSGQALCSDGTNYVNPCSVAGTGITALTGPVTASGSGSVASTITPTGVTAASYTIANVTVNAAGQITAASSGGTSWSHGSNSNGSWRTSPDGFTEQWGHLSSLSGAACNTITFPISFTAIPSNISATDDFASGGSVETAITFGGSHSCANPSTASMTVWPSSGGNGVWWTASGY